MQSREKQNWIGTEINHHCSDIYNDKDENKSITFSINSLLPESEISMIKKNDILFSVF